MGLGEGGCGYGNLLNQDKYPYLMAIALSGPTREALGLTTGVGCGGCVRMTCDGGPHCKDGSIVGVVTDVCPDTPGHSSGKTCDALQIDMCVAAPHSRRTAASVEHARARCCCACCGCNLSYLPCLAVPSREPYSCG